MPPLDETVFQISGALRGLDPGPLANLRRMNSDGPGAPMFWRLAARHDFGSGQRLTAWKRIVRIMAILTPRGERQSGHAVHDKKRRLGEALCDGGDPNWSSMGRARPVLSEQRLAKLLAARGDQRALQLERSVRMLARSRDPSSGVNCTDIAALLLFSQDSRPVQDIARTYYARLDHAERKSQPDSQPDKRGTR